MFRVKLFELVLGKVTNFSFPTDFTMAVLDFD